MHNYNPVIIAEKIRPRMIDLKNEKFLLAVLSGTGQAQDLTAGRFFEDVFRSKIYTKPDERTTNPFLGEPAGIAAEKLSIPGKTNVLPEECNAAFLGQLNGCNLKCWYCYVDDKAKSTNPKYGKFFSAEEYLTQFLIESRKNQNLISPELKLNVLRISGGEVFIVPEIISWIIEAVEKFKLENSIYLWVDCNLTVVDFYFKFLTEEQRKKIKSFRNIGFCVCYKGFTPSNYHENTCGAMPEFFDKQFPAHRRLIMEGLDVYSYLYPVTSSADNLEKDLSGFIDRLQKEVEFFAPLRMATPVIKVYGPTKERLDEEKTLALKNQFTAMEIWKKILRKRFTPFELSLTPHQVTDSLYNPKLKSRIKVKMEYI